MTWAERLREVYVDGVDTTTEPATVDVDPATWVEALTSARDRLGCSFFDFLTAVDEGDGGFHVVCHVAAHRPGAVDHVVLRTLLTGEAPRLASVTSVFAGAHWHERETHEMFGIDFLKGDEVLALDRLLLPPGFDAHPLRKDFVLASRVARPWPGAKEPGESESTPVPRRSRRVGRPPGVPAPEEWGPHE